MTEAEFETILDKACEILGEDVRKEAKWRDPDEFELHVRDVLEKVAHGQSVKITPTFHPHAFPDIRGNGFGVEVKTSKKDSWLAVGNSVFEGMRDPSVKKIYVVFGKFGGMPSVKWGRYDERITHVRISHAPRFVIEMDRDSSIFGKMQVGYDDFAQLPPEDKMRHIRDYSRGRLKAGERLWWLEDESSPGVPLQVRLYMRLEKPEKTRLRAQGAILFPQIVGGSRVRDKYNDVAFFFLKYHNVFCPQTRDLFSAGSVAGKALGGNYLMRALQNIEKEMEEAALTLDGELIREYWGSPCEPKKRLAMWLQMADSHAKNWTPSKVLFKGLKTKDLLG